MKVGKAWSFVCREYIQENREKSSINRRKYWAPIVDGVGADPHRSVWIKARGWETLEFDKENGNLWLFATGQAEQTSRFISLISNITRLRALVRISSTG